MRALRTLVSALLLSSLASGYYHWIHFAGRTGPFNGIPEKFDLNALLNKTVLFQITDQLPQLGVGDSQAALISEIRSAAKAWSDIDSSDIRLRLSGLFTPGGPAPATPSIDVVFDDLPPGLNGLSSHTVNNAQSSGTFVPIQHSVVVLDSKLVERGRQSWTEAFYLTAVHEFGHALGLQHSFASGAMATEITRATTKAKPITPDDAAGVSLLYPAQSFGDRFGSIGGRVLAGGSPMAMASVVAISPRGPAVSALTKPDGTYRIEGLPPGQYYLYVHPLPPASSGESTPGNVVLPVDSGNRSLDSGGYFDTLFYPNSRQPDQVISVEAGGFSDGRDFNVNRRTSAPGIYAVQTYSFPGRVAVKPAHLYTNAQQNSVIAAGAGLVVNNQPAQGLQVGVLSGTAFVVPGSLRPYVSSPGYYVQMDFQFSQFATEGPSHLMFTRNNEIYVLPYGFRLVERSAPQIDSVVLRGDSAIVSGSGITQDSRILFDGATAVNRSVDESGRLLVALPAGQPGQTSSVVALSPDGQSSLFLQSPVPITFEGTASASAPAQITVTPSAIPAGSETLVEINGSGFVEGSTVAGFGTSDVQVHKLWVTSPTHLLANVYAAPGATGVSATLSLTTGVQFQTHTGALQVAPFFAKAIQISVPGAGLVPGSTASLSVTGASSTQGAQLALDGRALIITANDGSTLAFNVPANLAPGGAALRLQLGGDSAQIGVSVLQAPALISGVVVGLGAVIDSNRPARPGDLLTITIAGLPESASAPGATPKVSISVGGITHNALTYTPLGGSAQTQIVLLNSVASGQQPMTVTVDGTVSQTYTLPVRAAGQ